MNSASADAGLLPRGAGLLWAAVIATCAPAPSIAGALSGDGAREIGLASYYARRFEGRRTASGDRYSAADYTAAHPRLPLGTAVRVTRVHGEQSVVVTINDRGPSRTHQRRGVIIDLSHAAARDLDLLRAGRARVVVEVTAPPGAARAIPSPSPSAIPLPPEFAPPAAPPAASSEGLPE